MFWRIHKVVAKTNSRLFQEKYVLLLISGKLVEQSKLDHTKLKKTKNLLW